MFEASIDHTILRDVLAKAGFDDNAVLARLGIQDFPSLKSRDFSLLMRRTNSGDALDTLVRLFLIGVPCPVGDVARAVAPINPESLAAAGLIKVAGGQVTAAIKMLPHRGLYIAFDQPGILLTGLKENYVMGIGSSTLTLANVTIRKHSRNTLDLGCGCGYHALLAASHSEKVFASDINPRALDYTRFNAALNGFENVICVEGSLFEPFDGHRFDLIISNPPFVISPEKRYIYRDGGMAGDELCRQIVKHCGNYMEEGGFLQMLCNWAEYERETWADTLSRWFDGSGCDSWVIRSETKNIFTYAANWIKHTEKEDLGNYQKRLDEWLEYYGQLGIGSVGSGVINMRKSAEKHTWFRPGESPEKMLGPCGINIELGFETFDFLFAADDETLLGTRFKLSEDARLERVSVPTPEGWADESITLTLAKGLVYSGGIDPVMSNMLISCDGRHTLEELLKDVSSAAGIPVDNLSKGFCNLIRDLAAKGFLLRGF
jgi:SAM-dependent methyltransferase